MRQLLDADGSVLSVYEDVPSEDGFLIRTVQDCRPILDRNKELQNQGDGYAPGREWRRAATIPNVVIEDWLNRGLANFFDRNDDKKIKALLNDPEWRWLRTAPGRL